MTEEQNNVEGWVEIAGSRHRIYDFRDDAGKLSFVAENLSEGATIPLELFLMPGWSRVKVLGTVTADHTPDMPMRIFFQMLD